MPHTSRTDGLAAGADLQGDRPDGSGPVAVDVSIVIPTYNRRERLLRVLGAVQQQRTTTRHGREFTFEVIVISDGSTDGTKEAVARLDIGIPLTYLEQANSGPATARNRGVDAAHGWLVMFLDDDVIPDIDCLAAHVAHHDARADLVVIGPMLTPSDAALSPWVDWEQHQLAKQYEWFRSSPQASHVHFYTGNASVERRAVLDAGGFDSRFTRAEDIELAYRLAHVDQSFIVALDARAHHYAERSYESWLRTASEYGRNNVVFARSNRPEYWERIREDYLELSVVLRLFIRTLFRHDTASRVVSTVMRGAALLAHRLGMERTCRQMLSAIYGLAHVRGVTDALGSADEFLDLIRHGTRPVDDLIAVFVLEQTLGHVTHSNNLQELVPQVDRVAPIFLPVEFPDHTTTKGPTLLSNWTVAAGRRARRSLREMSTTRLGEHADALFVHTQVPAVLLGRWMRRLATVVSIDATPKQYDRLGAFYAHEIGGRATEKLKFSANVRCFARARHIVTWSHWAKRGLVEEYRVAPSKVTVISPGVDVERWARPAEVTPSEHVPGDHVEVLFVGADLHRKGGDLLIEAVRMLNDESDGPHLHLHLVTRAQVDPHPFVTVHHGLTANSAELIERYHRADIFCLPTLGDCLPMVLAEAAAAGLPLISTDVGAIHEIVQADRTGLLCSPGDLAGLTNALRTLSRSPDLRRDFGAEARRLAEREHDARQNARRIVDLLRTVADDQRAAGAGHPPSSAR